MVADKGEKCLLMKMGRVGQHGTGQLPVVNTGGEGGEHTMEHRGQPAGGGVTPDLVPRPHPALWAVVPV